MELFDHESKMKLSCVEGEGGTVLSGMESGFVLSRTEGRVILSGTKDQLKTVLGMEWKPESSFQEQMVESSYQ